MFEIKEGDALRFKGPYGKFAFDSSFEGDVILIGAGTGITPLMSIIRYCTDRPLPNTLNLLYSVRTPESIIYRKELEDHKGKNHHFDCTITVTRPDESQERWNGKIGRIDESMIQRAIPHPQTSVVFICGAKEFVFSMIEMLEGMGIKKEQIKTDVWG